MKLFVVIKKEFLEIVRKKSFIIGTVLLPLFFLGIIFLPAYFAMKTSRVEAEIKVIDKTGDVYSKLKKEIGKTIKKDEKIGIDYEKEANMNLPLIKISLEKIEIKGKANLKEIEKELKKEVEEKKIYGYLIIPENFYEERKVIFKAKNVSNLGLIETLRSALKKVATKKILKEENFPEEKISELTRSVSIETLKIQKGKERKSEFLGEYMLSIFMITLMFSVLLGYGQILMRSIIEEKSSRIVEIVLSSTDTMTYFSGKILGVGLAGLFQVFIWGGMLTFGYGYVILYMPKDFKGVSISFTVLIFFSLFFILGYFLYASLYAIAGAVSNSEEEAQQFVQPLVFLLLIPFIFAFSAIQNPDNTITIILSFIPFLTPIIMFLRVSSSTAPLWQVAVSVVLLIISLIFFIFAGAKIFRIGILSYGKKPTLREIFNWLKVK